MEIYWGGRSMRFLRYYTTCLQFFCPSNSGATFRALKINCWHIFQAADAHKSVIFFPWNMIKFKDVCERWLERIGTWDSPPSFPFTGVFVPLERPIPSHRRGPNKWCRVWMDYALVQSMKKALRQIQVVWQGQKKQKMTNHSGNRTKTVIESLIEKWWEMCWYIFFL